ncbi:MAG TPA: helix-turn-helix domain-containing protein [Candidatus Absconditabacterales bacterium]|nr:helix-turn-helix domain-containing protein [Candidatus Absconditabacterales bacterium]
MVKNYSITRENAAKALGVSTRTIDRYVKSGKLSYKKVANKVLLSKEEITELQRDFGALRQEPVSEIVGPVSTTRSVTTVNPSIEQAIDAKIEKFFLIFNEKDKILEEKNKVIFMLQQRIGELETKIKNMVALPDYSREKQEAIIEKQKLEEKISILKSKIRSEKTKNLVFIGASLVLIIIAIFFFMQN